MKSSFNQFFVAYFLLIPPITRTIEIKLTTTSCKTRETDRKNRESQKLHGFMFPAIYLCILVLHFSFLIMQNMEKLAIDALFRVQFIKIAGFVFQSCVCVVLFMKRVRIDHVLQFSFIDCNLVAKNEKGATRCTQ